MQKEMKKKRIKKDESKLKTEWVLCLEDWRDIVIKYVPQLNNIAIEVNYTDISQEEIGRHINRTKEEAQMKRAQ